ncbi:hypothetical protein EOE18_15315 [Novosphingobium umbonatum]|uniref:Uncharacterized protein n=1 Tax=Novosphingobium umbonatum TaxID=1908524 RepID=A0A3S2X1S9_9SPHN|nr:hypothetical protein [Novosphingobium umbonatum]RVU03490.1 hypothetical protein EOE18_15315 [Novosphingobium umbonatum]
MGYDPSHSNDATYGANSYSSMLEAYEPTPSPTAPERDLKNPTSSWLKDYAVHGLLGGVEAGIRQTISGFVHAESVVDYVDDLAHNLAATAAYKLSGSTYKVPAVHPDGTVRMVAPDFMKGTTYHGDEIVKTMGLDGQWIDKPERTGASIVHGIASFAVPFSAARKAMGTAEVFANWGKAGEVAKGVLASAGVAFSSVHPAEQNLANVAEHFGLDKTAFAQFTHVDSLINALSVDQDDNALEARLKTAMADMGGNVLVEGALSGLVRSVRAVRDIKLTRRSFEVSSEAADITVPMETAGLGADAETFANEAAGGEAPHAPAEEVTQAPAAEPPVTGKSPEAKAASDPIAQRRDTVKPITTMDDMVANLEKLGKTVTDDELHGLMDDFRNGVGFEALERMGVAPARQDWSTFLGNFSNPKEMEQGIHDILERIAAAPVTQRIAGQLGVTARTDTNVAFLSRMLGSDVVKLTGGLAAKTKHLDMYVRAASSLVAGEAAKLVAFAKKLEAAEKAGTFSFEDASHADYALFEKQFHTLITLQAAMRGSFSEMGRGLRAIQVMNQARMGNTVLDTAKEVLGEEGTKEAGKRLGKPPRPPKKSWEETMKEIGEAKTPDQRRVLVEKVLKSKGNLADVAEQAARDEGTLGARAARISRESAGNLFSIGTFTSTGLGATVYASMHLIAGLVNVPMAAWLKTDGYRAAAAANNARWAVLGPALGNSMVRAINRTVHVAIEEAGRTADAISSEAGRATRDTLKNKWDASFVGSRLNKFTPAYAKKFAKDAADHTVNKFERSEVNHGAAIYMKPETVDMLAGQDNHGLATLRIGLAHTLGFIVNGFGSATRMTTHMAIGFLDEVVGSALYHSNKYAEATAAATRDAIERGLAGEEAKKHVKDMAERLVSASSGDTAAALQNLVEAGSRDTVRLKQLATDVVIRKGMEDQAGSEARMLLFQDEMQTGLGKWAKKGMQGMDPAGVLFPFVHTPLRILETGLRDFTPLGAFQRKLYSDLRSGDSRSAEAWAKMAMGTLAMLEGYNMAARGEAVGYDGGTSSSARAARPQYSMKVGGKWVEYGRIDPLALVIGIGADIHQFEQQLHASGLHDDPEAQSKLADFANASWMALSANVLSKTYLSGLKNLTKLPIPEQSQEGFFAILQGLEQRLVPGGGIQKGLSNEITDSTPQTMDPASVQKQLLNQYVSSWFFSKNALWEQRDPFLGQVVNYDRDAGIKVADHDSDPLYKAMGDLSFRMPKAPTRLHGVRLSGDQMHTLLQHLGEDKIDGKTLADTLREYAVSPEWETYTPAQKLQVMKLVRQPYLDNAQQQLLTGDKDLNKAVQYSLFRKDVEKSGAPEEIMSQQLKTFRDQLDKL